MRQIFRASGHNIVKFVYHKYTFFHGNSKGLPVIVTAITYGDVAACMRLWHTNQSVGIVMPHGMTNLHAAALPRVRGVNIT